MKFFRKRRSDEEFGRRRTAPAAQYRGPVFSYHASRSMNEGNIGRAPAPETLRRRGEDLGTLMRRAALLVVTLACVVVITSQLALSANPKVVVLSDSGGEVFLRATSAYAKAADQLFAQSFDNRNKLTVDAAGISSSLRREFPELEGVSVALPVFGSQPVVYIQPAEPSLVLATRAGSFVLDTSGRALAAVGGLSPQLTALRLPTVTDESGLEPRLGGSALPASDVSFIRTVLAQLDAQHVGVQRIVLPPVASEVDIYIAGKPYYAKFNMQDQNGALQQVGTLIATSDDLTAQGKSPKAYIDVRLAGRAYYK